MRTTLMAALLCATGFVYGPAVADAQESDDVVPATTPGGTQGQIEGKTRLHIDTPVISFTHWSISEDESGDSISGNSFNVNLGVPLLTLGLGYGLSENMVLGTSALFDFASSEGTSRMFFAISPYLNYVMGMAGDTVRPFVGAALNFAFSSTSPEFGDSSSTWMIGGGPQGGLLIFLADAVSLDLTARAAVLYGSGDAGELDPEFGGIEGSGFAIDVTGFIGLSGWL